MQSDFDELTELNHQISVTESAGDKQSLDGILAPVVAFRRASGAFDDRASFLEKVASSIPRETTIRSIDLVGQDRAVVTCVVSMPEGDQEKIFHNVRLFVRVQDSWKLLGWANEPA